VVARATSWRRPQGLGVHVRRGGGRQGLTLVVVRCTGAVPALLASLGNLLPLEVTGRAVKEGA
jgi:hypothetical protein